MSVNSTEKKQSIPARILNEGKNMAAGALIGAAGGKAVSLAMPVSHKQIANEIVDHFVHANKDGITDLITEKALAEWASGIKADNLVKHIQDMKPDEFKVKYSQIEELFANIGEKLPEGAKDLQKSAAETLEKFITKNSRSDEQISTLSKSIDAICAKADDLIKTFKKTPRKERAADDIVGLAKKCAKKTQAGKIIGIGVLAGICAMFFRNIFAAKTPKDVNANEQQEQVKTSKVQTHQG